MHKDYNMTQLTLPLETSVLIPTNDIVETIPETEFDDFICQTIKDQDLKDMPIVMINMVLNETLK